MTNLLIFGLFIIHGFVVVVGIPCALSIFLYKRVQRNYNLVLALVAAAIPVVLLIGFTLLSIMNDHDYPQ